MITITNVTDPLVSNAQPNHYELAINGNVLSRFTHYPIHGLAYCLRRAATALGNVEELERQSRFTNETKPDPKEVPDEKDGLRCEEILHAEAQAVEADLEEKDCLAGGIPEAEVGPRGEALVWALRIADYHRERCELASSLRAENASNLVACDPGVRPMP